MLLTEKPSYSAIWNQHLESKIFGSVIADYYATLFSPLFTLLFLRWKIIPNVVTVMMIGSGVLGAAIFALPGMAAKILGAVLIHLWYILDCSDGEVARITRIFSSYGTQLDQIAHAICHPLFNLSFACALIALHRYNVTFILLLSVVSISAEMLLRHLIDLSTMYLRKSDAEIPSFIQRSRFRIVTGRLLGIFYVYPNFAMLFPVLYLADRLCGTSLSYMYLVAQASFSVLEATRLSGRWLRILYQS